MGKLLPRRQPIILHLVLKIDRTQGPRNRQNFDSRKVRNLLQSKIMANTKVL